MPTIFTKLVKGELPSHQIAEDSNYFAFLDINPIAKGHTLVIPKPEIDYFYDLDDQTLAGLMQFSKKIALALKLAVPCERISTIVAGFDVPHAHVHLIPANTMADLDFRNKVSCTPEELAEIAESIKKHL